MRVMLIASYAPSLLNFRGDLIRDFLRLGWDVHAAAPEFSDSQCSTWCELHSWGVHCHAYPLGRTGMNPVHDLRTLWGLYTLIGRLNPDLVLAYTIKPVIYGMLAASWRQVPQRAALITGLGFSFGASDSGGIARVAATVARWLYGQSLRRTHKVFFQNPDDRDLFLERGMVGPEQVELTAGSGVNLERFACEPLPDAPPVYYRTPTKQ